LYQVLETSLDTNATIQATLDARHIRFPPQIEVPNGAFATVHTVTVLVAVAVQLREF
jgi:hypothetical protein